MAKNPDQLVPKFPTSPMPVYVWSWMASVLEVSKGKYPDAIRNHERNHLAAEALNREVWEGNDNHNTIYWPQTPESSVAKELLQLPESRVPLPSLFLATI
jgi:hypothetical protein